MNHFARSSKTIASATFCFLLFGCQSSSEAPVESPQYQSEEDAQTRINQTLQLLRDDGYKVSSPTYSKLSDGTTHHMSIILQKGKAKAVRGAVLMTGEFVSHRRVKQLFYNAVQEKYGRIGPHAEYIYESRPDQKFHFAIWYNANAKDLNTFEKSIRQLSSDAIIRETGPPVAFVETSMAEIFEIGLHKLDSSAGIYPLTEPVMYQGSGSGPCSNLVASNTSSARWSRADNAFNARGYHADGIKIGVVEGIADDTLIWDGHQALSYANVIYQATPQKTCALDQECPPRPKASAGICRYSNKYNDYYCVEAHTSQVASRISHTDDNGNPRMAAKATLYIANKGDFATQMTAGNYSGVYNTLIERYEFLENVGTLVINESWGMIKAFEDYNNTVAFPTFHDSLNTWYTNKSGITFVRASGNTDDENTPQTTDCHSLASICVGSVDARCTYNNYLDDLRSPESAWRNPYNEYTDYGPGIAIDGYKIAATDSGLGKDFQVERPDVVAEADNSVVMDLYPGNVPSVPDANYVQNIQNDAYSRRYRPRYPDDTQFQDFVSGTSFAAPVVTGLIALCADVRGVSTSSSQDPMYYKVMTRMAAKEAHTIGGSTDMFYPTYTITNFMSGISQQEYLTDSYVGAGIIDSNSLFNWCEGNFEEEGDEDREVIDVTINLAQDGMPVPDDAITGVPPNGTGGHITIGSIPQSLRTTDDSSSHLKQYPLFTYNNIEQDDRLRVVGAYDVCPETNVEPSPGVDPGLNTDLTNPSARPKNIPSYDVDLFLCGTSEGDYMCETYSESVTDHVEGFDIIFSRDYEQVVLYKVWDDRDRNCFNSVSSRMFAASSLRRQP